MTTLVIDSSVIIKWLNQDSELFIEQADLLLKHAVQNKVELLAPELAKYEVGNVLLKGKKLSNKQFTQILETMSELPIRYIGEDQQLAQKSFEIATKFMMTYYDAVFVALSDVFGAKLVTDNLKHQGKASSVIEVISLKDYR